MFGTIKLDSESGINYQNNFQSLGNAMLLLFRKGSCEFKMEIFFTLKEKKAEIYEKYDYLKPTLALSEYVTNRLPIFLKSL